jgi:hypothetical protein
MKFNSGYYLLIINGMMMMMMMINNIRKTNKESKYIFNIFPNMSYFLYYMGDREGYFKFGDSSLRNYAKILPEFENKFPLIKKNSSIILDAKPEANMKVWNKAQDYTTKLIAQHFAEFQYFGEHQEWFKTTKVILNRMLLIIQFYGYSIDSNGKISGALSNVKRFVSDFEFHIMLKEIIACSNDNELDSENSLKGSSLHISSGRYLHGF